MKLWGGRFESGPSEVFERFSGSLHFDQRLIDADCRGSQAFARALQQVGILTADECATLVDAFEKSRNDQVSLDLRLWLRGEIDVILVLLWELLASLLRMAQHDPDAIVPGYTHT